jgi:hypothetical protein
MGLFAFRRLRERQQEASATAGAFPIAEEQSTAEDAVKAAEVPAVKRSRVRRQTRGQEAI